MCQSPDSLSPPVLLTHPPSFSSSLSPSSHHFLSPFDSIPFPVFYLPFSFKLSQTYFPYLVLHPLPPPRLQPRYLAVQSPSPHPLRLPPRTLVILASDKPRPGTGSRRSRSLTLSPRSPVGVHLPQAPRLLLGFATVQRVTTHYARLSFTTSAPGISPPKAT